MRASCLFSAVTLAYLTFPAAAEPPRVSDDRLVLELVAREPDLVTPTGLAVDALGRAWVIENHTHHRPPNYKGPETDRIRVFANFDESGKARSITTFADGFKDAMSLALAKDGSVYLATRSEIFLLGNKDGKISNRRSLVKLETTATYPHNGLCGFAFDGTGRLYFGMGENLGASYKLVGSDGTTLQGGGEGGNIFCCQPDGSKLHRVATGFWNPFHHGFDAFGRLFAVDNDPDSRGPCRLLHVVEGGDYGYRFRYGRKGTHPFQAWNGELPGTLGMVAGTGEAPSGVVAYESTGLPPEYRGHLLVTSWGDHLIERFRLVPQGASFTSTSQTMVRGGDDFRPVAIAVAPDGSVFFTDWVDKSYPVHGKGRLWRLRAKKPAADDGLRPAKVAGLDADKLGQLLAHPRRDIRDAAADALVKKGRASKDMLAGVLRGKGETRGRLQALWAAARLGNEGADLVAAAMEDREAELRAEAVRLAAAGPFLEKALKDPSPFVRMQAVLRVRKEAELKQMVPLLADKDPFIASAAVEVLGRPRQSALLVPHIDDADAKLRLGVLVALRRTGDAEARSTLAKYLKDADPEIRRTSIQWVGEEKLKEFAPQLQASASRAPVNRSLFLSLVAANHLLAGGKPDAEPVDEKYLARVVPDVEQPGPFRVLAMQMLRPEHPALAAAALDKLLADKNAELRRQALRTLTMCTDQAAQELLLRLAKDEKLETAWRPDVIGGLAASAPRSADTRRSLFAALDRPELRRDALRSLRAAAVKPEVEKDLLVWWDRAEAGKEERPELAAQLLLALKASKTPAVEKLLPKIAAAATPRPKSNADWTKFLASGGDPVAGERVFFHLNGPRCVTCHRIHGRGGKIGPDLSTIGAALNRERLIESILEPSKEIAPMFVTWSIALRDGKVITGVVVDEGPDSTVTVADAQGNLTVLKRQDIEERVALPTSLMPDNLHEQMTPLEFLDVIAFLVQRK